MTSTVIYRLPEKIEPKCSKQNGQVDFSHVLKSTQQRILPRTIFHWKKTPRVSLGCCHTWFCFICHKHNGFVHEITMYLQQSQQKGFCAVERLMNIFPTTNCYLICWQQNASMLFWNIRRNTWRCWKPIVQAPSDVILPTDCYWKTPCLFTSVGCYMVCLVQIHRSSACTFSVNEIYWILVRMSLQGQRHN